MCFDLCNSRKNRIITDESLRCKYLKQWETWSEVPFRHSQGTPGFPRCTSHCARILHFSPETYITDSGNITLYCRKSVHFSLETYSMETSNCTISLYFSLKMYIMKQQKHHIAQDHFTSLLKRTCITLTDSGNIAKSLHFSPEKYIHWLTSLRQ